MWARSRVMARGTGMWARLVSGVLCALFPSALPAQETGATVILRGTLTDNTYVAGGTIDVLGDIERDLMAAGGTVGSQVGGDVVAAGGTVTLAPEAQVGGRAWLSGGRVTVAGRVARELKVAAASASVAGAVDGDVRITAQTIEILPTARIKGDLAYMSAKPARIDPEAQIQGRVIYTQSDLPARAGRMALLMLVLARIGLLAGLVACGLILLWLFPGFTVSAARAIGRDPWRSLGLGFLLLITTPIAAIVLMITIIGIPVGLTLVALYAVALLLAYLTAAVFLGELGTRLVGRGPELSAGGRMLSLVLALIVLGLIGLIPIVGWIIVWLAVVTGLGAASQHAFRRWSEARS